MANNKQRMEYTIAFTADIAKAKQQLQSLQTQLTKLGQLKFTRDDGGFGITKEIQTALNAVSQLQAQLNNAINVDTGKLDLGKFSSSLKSSGMSLASYRKQLEKLGPEGDQAFKTLAMSIANAEMPLKRTSQLMSDFAVTMKNTLKWQISSSVLHTLMGAMQTAYGYAEDLNASLNDIRIVTGYSADKMADFAVEANKAAKALSATTREYTNASLIYFQQGLSDTEVKERTDVTVKMANVTRESAETVSDQMTAVWNNFYDGSKSIEYYSDVMVKLGADTASSADEIAQGLEKFAAVSNTVGLSYEYAASALTTITATTRQSADVVGTALKTLFARIQGLNLGETQDDGTTLNQYSEALQKVGISIKDTNGDLKDMDSILDEMGAKWETLSNAEQVALAQTVAGIRQYSQLIALMDNWSYFQENLTTAYESEGALQEQADIYAESWEAARDRVTAAAETIYEKLIDDDAFIDLLNGAEKILEFIDELIDALGGLPGILTGLGALVTKLLGPQIQEGLQNVWANIKRNTKTYQKELEELKKSGYVELERMAQSTGKPGQGDADRAMAKDALSYLNNSFKLTEEQKREFEIQLDINRAIHNKMVETEKILQQIQNENTLLEEQYDLVEHINNVNRILDDKDKIDMDIFSQQGAQSEAHKILSEDIFSSFISDDFLNKTYKNEMGQILLDEKSKQQMQALEKELKDFISGINDISAESFKEIFGEEYTNAIEDLLDSLQHLSKDGEEEIEQWIKKLQEAQKALSKAEKDTDEKADHIRDAINTSFLATEEEGEIRRRIYQEASGKQAEGVNIVRQGKNYQDSKNANKNFKEKLQGTLNLNGDIKEWSVTFTEAAKGATSLTFGIQSITNAIDSLQSSDTSWFEKILTLTSALTMGIPQAVSGVQSLEKVYRILNTQLIENRAQMLANLKIKMTDLQATLASMGAKIKDIVTNKAHRAALWEDTKATIANTAAKVANLAVSNPLALAIAAVVAVIGTAVVAYKKYNEEAAKAKKAAEEAEKLAKGYENVKNSYNNLLSTISAYDEAVNSFEKLIKGTDEWTEALDKANDEATQLLKTYKNLEYTIDDNGLIIIDQDSLQQQKEETRNQMLNAQSASRLASNRAEELQLKADQTKLKRDKLDSNAIGSKDSWDKANTGAKIGTAVLGTVGAIALGSLGSLLGPVGTAIGAAAGLAIGNAVGAAVGGTIGGLIGLGTGNATKAEQETLDKIADRYEEIGNALFASKDGFREELKNLGITDEKLIDSLVENMDAVQKNTQALILNEKSNIEATKNDIKQAYGTKIENANLSDKDENFVLDIVAEKTNEKAEELKDTDDYSHRALGNKEKKEDFAEEYAKAMGYTISSTIRTYSKTVSFKDAEGNEINDVSFDTIERYLAYQKAVEDSKDTLDDYIQKERDLDKIEAELSEGRVTSAAEYEDNLKELIKEAKELGFTEEQIKEHYGNSEYASWAAASSTIADSLMTGVFGSGLKDKSDKEKENFKGYIQSFIDNLTAGMNDQEIEVAIEAAADARTLDEFSRLLADGLLQATADGLEASMTTIQEKIANEDGISISDLLKLQDDENFVAYLESTNQQMSDIISGNYSERKAIATDYYNWLENQSSQTYQQQIDQYQRDLAEWQAIFDYKTAEENNDSDTKKALEDNFDNINFEAYMDIDISEAESKIDEISGKIDDLSNKQIEVALDWSGVDNITNSFKEAGEFVNLIEQDAKKVGNTYQLTANQAREWAEIYPEIFAEAETTTDGMISLTEEEVENFKEGQETKRDEAIDTEIANIESQERELEAKIEAIDVDIALAEANATGKAELEKASAEYLAETRSKLTDYFIECGLDEADANYQALQAMGLNQNEYNELIAEKSKENSENAQKSILEPAKKLVQVLKSCYTNISNFASAVWKKIKNPDEAFDFSWTSISDGVNSDIQTGSDIEDTGIKKHYTSKNEVTNDDRKLALDSINNEIIESLKSSKAAAQQALATLGAKKIMAQAQKDQDISSFSGSDKKDEDSGSKDEEETLSSEAERYHEIDRELKNISRELDQIEKKKDKAFGGKKLALMDQELEVLNEELDATGEKIEEAKKNLTSDQEKLNFFGATYNDQGEVTNYDELYAQEEAIYNTAMASGDEDAIDAAKERWEYFKEVFGQYEDTLDTLKDTQDEEQEIIDKIAEQKLAKIQYELELKINVIDMSEDWVDYQLSKLEDESFSSAEKVLELGNKMQLTLDKNESYVNSVTDMLTSKGMSDDEIQKLFSGDMSVLDKYDFTEDEVQMIQDTYSSLIEGNQELYETMEEIKAELTNVFEEYTEEIEKNIETIGKYTDVLENYKNIIDLLGVDQLGLSDEFMTNISKASIDFQKTQIKATKDELEGIQKSRAAAEAKLAEAMKTGSAKDIEYWTEQVDALKNKELETQNDLLTSVASTLEALKTLYEEQIEKIFDDLEKQIAGKFGNLSSLEEAFTRQKTLNEQTIADYKKIYELNKLNTQISNDIDNTNNIKAKQALRNLQAEIAKYQEDGVEMSEYELEYLQKQYDVELAKIALEEAQNAKSQVRLTRDASGNYSYTYTADADKVSDARQNYYDTLYAAQDVTENYLTSQQDLLMQYANEYIAKIKEIWQDSTLTQEEKEAKIQETTEYYTDLMNTISGNIQLGLDNNAALYQSNKDFFDSVMEGMTLSWNSFTTQFDQTALGATLGEALGPGGSLETWWNNFQTNVVEALSQCDFALSDYNTDQNAILNAAGLDIATFGDTIVNWMSQASGEVDTLGSKVKTLAEDLPEDYKTIADTVEEYQKKWNDSIDDTIKKYEELLGTFGNVYKTLTNTPLPEPNSEEPDDNNNNNNKNDTPSGGTTSPSGGTTSPSGGTTSSSGNTSRGYIINYKNNDSSIQSLYENIFKTFGFTIDTKNKTAKITTTDIDKVSGTNGFAIKGKDSKAIGVAVRAIGFEPVTDSFSKKGAIDPEDTLRFKVTFSKDNFIKKASAFRSGGYTGDWNSEEGKLAILHEKELILNKTDTENMLNIVSVVRDVVDSSAKASSRPISVSSAESEMISELNQLTTLMEFDKQMQALEQQIKIQAEFPNVVDHLEIEQALNSLVNKATQYAYKNQ